LSGRKSLDVHGAIGYQAYMASGRRYLLVLVLPLLSTGCYRYLVETPNLLRQQDAKLFYADCPTQCQSADAPVMYATDRAIDQSTGQPQYGYGRSGQLAFGVATVRLNPAPTWKELVADSTQANRGRNYELLLAKIEEDGRFLQRSKPREIVRASQEPDAYQVFQDALRQRLAQTANKDVFIFVHGFNNKFDDSVFRAAEVWHFMGRVGVPIAYSWPAGRGGVRGYAYDHESGDFTVGHLRQFIKLVAECPEVERVHIVAHSRGCDVAMSALRELQLIYNAQDKSTQQELKLENLVLAAPDVDEEVFMQRFVGENLLQAARRTTIYASAHDRAVELSDLVFASNRRVGMLAVKDFNPKMKRGLAKCPNVTFVECKLSGLWIGHNYVFTHPAALSDLILVLRDRRDPGAEHGRPLHQPADGIWELRDDYLAAK
jgi:esterase/lipase superfamily enzyme